MRRLWATKSAINGCPTSDCQTAIPVIMESFTQGHHKAICRYQYNIDRIAAKYLRMASMTNAVICLDTMKVEFEDGPEGHTLKEYQMVNRIAAIFRRDSFGNAHISSPLLSGLSRRDVDICDRINKDFERKYDSNAFDNIPFEDLSDFLPPSVIFISRIELSEEHRVVDYKVDNGGRLVQTVTKYDKKLIISPEKPLAGSCNQFFRMLIGESVLFFSFRIFDDSSRLLIIRATASIPHRLASSNSSCRSGNPDEGWNFQCRFYKFLSGINPDISFLCPPSTPPPPPPPPPPTHYRHSESERHETANFETP
ncbi:unnamed protein product [Toxocara canis]|uniref:START domain-containing protein n=1 Tax=Toxocara canis TaxID=6265 RepID=A0A183TVQ9_TOXCA|nr:unnamed protein product [Toxocara canis]